MTRQALTHDDACRLSRAFNQAGDLRDPQDARINEWLKALISNPAPAADMLASITSPGHTDLMVTPESIDKFMEENPLAPEPVWADLDGLEHFYIRLVVASGHPKDNEPDGNDACLGQRAIKLRHDLKAVLAELRRLRQPKN